MMDQQEDDFSISTMKPKISMLHSLNSYRSMNGTMKNSSIWFEIRLFYVRISPCAIDTVPDHLSLRHLPRDLDVSLEINGSHVAASKTTSCNLRRDRVDKELSEVTYVSTDSVRITGGVDFEINEGENLMLCGSLERVESNWSMNCYTAVSIAGGTSSFWKPKLGISSPSIEVYVAGCCSGVPVILTKTFNISPRRKAQRYSVLDAIPEDEEVEKQKEKVGDGFTMQMKSQLTDTDVEDYESDGKLVYEGYNWYSEEMYNNGEDGQLTWFNAGVRVGVGIGLGMCLGIGIGVGLLMRSYQATTRNFKRRFF